MRTVFGDEALDRVGPVWGIDKEGELRGCYRPTGHPGVSHMLFIAAIALIPPDSCGSRLENLPCHVPFQSSW